MVESVVWSDGHASDGDRDLDDARGGGPVVGAGTALGISAEHKGDPHRAIIAFDRPGPARRRNHTQPGRGDLRGNRSRLLYRPADRAQYRQRAGGWGRGTRVWG